MQFVQARPVSLRQHPEYDERWLQDRIAEDPALLGLGDLELKDRERRQPRAGRLDLLLSDPESLTRYEVEIQLGPTDEAHIIRTIEYWDVERARYPQYDHVAVLVAEDVTSRFLNVIALFNKAIPLVAVQLKAFEVDGALTLVATTVLDLMTRGTDEEDDPGSATDRGYWLGRGSPATVSIADEILALVNQVSPGHVLKFNKHYIGLANAAGSPDNFVLIRPRRQYSIAAFRIPRSDEVSDALEASGLDVLPYYSRGQTYRLRLAPGDVETSRDLLHDLIRRASGIANLP